MSKAIVNKISIILFFILSAVILEMAAFYFLDLGFLPTNFWYDFAIILFLAMLIFAIPNYTAEYVVSLIILLIHIVLIYTNYSLYTIYGDIFTFDMFSLIKEAGNAVTSSFVYFRVILQLVAIFIAVAIVGYLILKHSKKHRIILKQHFSIFSIIIILGLQCFSLAYLVGDRLKIDTLSDITSKDYVYSDSFLLNTSFLKASSYKKFGTYGYYLNMIMNNFQTVDDVVIDSTIEYFDNGKIYNSSPVFGVDCNEIEDKRNNVIVFMMESVEWFTFGDGTYDASKNNLSPEITPNIYSLIYGEESLQGSNIDRSNDSLIARNFFSKNKTNLSEGLGVLGNHPVAENLKKLAGKDYNSALNTFGYSMPNVLSELGYTTSYVHSHQITFYDRNETHGNIGFDNVIGKDNLRVDGELIYTGSEVEFDNWENEADFVTNAMDYIVPANCTEKPFYTFYLNVSSHGPYDDYVNDQEVARYKNLIKYGADDCVLDAEGNYILNDGIKEQDRTYSSWYQNVVDAYGESDPKLCNELLYYECGVKGLDEAIGVVIEQLKDYGVYDETTILLYSDHNSYYENLSHRVKGIAIEDTTNYTELYSVPMIISSPGLKAYNAENDNIYIDNYRFCSAYDIIPTLFDLLGIEYNENFYIGNSLFKPLDHYYEYTSSGEKVDMVVFYSNTGGLFSKDIYSYDLTEFILESDDVDSSEIIERFKAETANVLIKINYITLMNNYNLYEKISNK